MTKKARNTRLEKLVRQNAARRESGRVFRVETLFSVNDKRQADLAEFLGDLPRGGASSFIRDAVWEKKTRAELGIGNGIVRQETASNQIEALFTELAAQRRAITDEFATTPTVDYHEARYNELKADNEVLRGMVQDLMGMVQVLSEQVKELAQREMVVETVTATRVSIKPDNLPEQDAALTQSSGINMSRERPRPKLKPGKVITKQEPDEWTDEEEYENRMKLVNSIKAYSGGKT